jgi:hypothetical protein
MTSPRWNEQEQVTNLSKRGQLEDYGVPEFRSWHVGVSSRSGWSDGPKLPGADMGRRARVSRTLGWRLSVAVDALTYTAPPQFQFCKNPGVVQWGEGWMLPSQNMGLPALQDPCPYLYKADAKHKGVPVSSLPRPKKGSRIPGLPRFLGITKCWNTQLRKLLYSLLASTMQQYQYTFRRH